MVCCPTTPSHYLKQYRLIIKKIQWYSYEGKFKQIPQPPIIWIRLKSTHLKSHSYLQGANELWYCVPYKAVNMARAMWCCRLSGWWYGWLCAIRTWWRHQMETFHKRGIIAYVNCSLTVYKWICLNQTEVLSALLALCVGNSPVTGELPAQRPVTRILDIFFDLSLNKRRLSKQSWCW